MIRLNPLEFERGLMKCRLDRLVNQRGADAADADKTNRIELNEQKVKRLQLFQ